jgi:large subunit ribosomal protein L18
MNDAKKRFERRKNRVRSRIERVAPGKIRLSIHKSNAYIYAQVIDDAKSLTVAAASSLEKAFKKKNKSNCNMEAATWVGSMVADRACAAGIEVVVFDQGGNKYHGVVKALADAARAKLKF